MRELVQKAEEIARMAHAGQIDKAGQPYIGHIERVAARVQQDGAKCVAWLHDVLEDTEILPEPEMRRIFGDAVTDGVLSVTRREDESYEEFVRRAGENPLGLAVKISDLIDNSNLSRLETVTLTDVQRQRKYNDALMYLLGGNAEKRAEALQAVRICDMPPCKMVTSPVGMFGDPELDAFSAWMETQPRSLFTRDFLTWDDSDPAHPGFCWYFMYEDGMTPPDGAQVVDFPGGMYAVATGVDQRTDKAAMNAAVAAFLRANGLMIDPDRRELGNIITSAAVQAVLGYEQMDYYYPVCSAK